MPELPDVELYVEALRARVVGTTLARVRIANPFVLRSVDPPIGDAEGRVVTGVSRLGKRIVIALEVDRFVVIHLMIAGRLRWRASSTKVPKKRGLAAFDFAPGMLLFTEEGSRRRAANTPARSPAPSATGTGSLRSSISTRSSPSSPPR